MPSFIIKQKTFKAGTYFALVYFNKDNKYPSQNDDPGYKDFVFKILCSQELITPVEVSLNQSN